MKRPISNTSRLHIDGRMIYMSGIGRCLREIIRELLNIGKNIEIYLYCRSTDHERYLKEYSVDGSRVHFMENNSDIYSIREQTAGSLINIRDRSSDIFYYPHYNLPYLIHPNSIFTIHDFIQFKFPEYFGKNKVRIAKFILNNSVRKAKKIIVDSESTASDFYDFFPDLKGKVEVIYNGISKDFRVIQDKKKKEFSKKNRLGKYILFIGANKPHKNIEGLISSFLDIKGKFKDLKLVIISAGFELDKILKKKELMKDIVVIEKATEEELISYYNCAHMFVLPSYYEGFGLPVLEAMACGCPVITSNISSMPEIGSNAAYYIDPNDNNSIVDGIVKLIKDSHLRNKLIDKGYKRAGSFTWKKTAAKYLEVFVDIHRTQI